jgi:(R,R)-butanediol dehydrogenase/meso-butanediol dehydrogenase/diacetyl reductase
MKALRWHARGDVRLDEIPPPPPPMPGEVQLEVLWCGLCGTDYEEYRHGPIFIPVTPHPLTGASAPITLGHEVSGVVRKTPDGSRLRVGDRVAVDGLRFCGRCRNCLRHRVTLCDQLSSIGLMSDGGLAEYVNVPELGCVVLPDSLSAESAALAETLAVGTRALRRGRMLSGDRVAVIGAGAVGLLAVQAARAMGASWIGVCDPSPARQKMALALGADGADGPGTLDALSADIVLECSGAPGSLADAMAASDKAGRIVLVGITAESAPLDVLPVVTGERELIGSLSHVYDEDFTNAVTMLASGVVDAEPLITARIALSAALQDGLLAIGAPKAGQVKILVGPGLDS